VASMRQAELRRNRIKDLVIDDDDGHRAFRGVEKLNLIDASLAALASASCA
jgi:hypothetical protein